MSSPANPIDMINLQNQIRENSSDLTSYLKDLQGWEDDIKNKDHQLQKDKPILEDKLPPVRNSLDKKKRKKVKKEPKEPELSKPKRINSYDYRAWDKFNVDAMLEDEDGTESSSEYETDEEWEVERRKQQALQEKDNGNMHFKNKEYDAAVECYTKGVDFDPTNALLPANRAMALLKLGKYGAAEVDCTSSLTLDPLYIKAYLRRGSARIGLKKFDQAKADFDRVLQLEPQNKLAKAELDKIEKELSREKLITSDSGTVKPIYIAPENRSKKPLMRMRIQEIGVDDFNVKRNTDSTSLSATAPTVIYLKTLSHIRE